jgi:hypothetical protein
VRIGNGSTGSVTGYVATAVYVDEYTVAAGTLRRTIALPTVQAGSQFACTLSADAAAHEGFGVLSGDGRVLMVRAWERENVT